MKEIKMYECGVCHTRYANRCTCDLCEKTHKEPKKIVGTRYLSYKQNEAGYPESITVEFKDGERRIYKR